MAAQTAIEYGTRRVRLVSFDGSGRKVRILGVEDVSLDVPVDLEGQDPDDFRARAIAKVLKEAGFASDPSVMGFDAGHAMFREFDLPFTANEQIAKVVRFEAEGYFPGDIDDYVLQHIVLRKSRDKSHVLAIAIRKDDLLDRLDILDESSIDPMLVDVDALALFNALVHSGVTEEHERFALIHAQDAAATLLFVVEGGLFAVRSIRIGSRGVAHEGEGAPEAVDSARTHDYLGRLVREIRRTVSTLPDLEELEVLYTSGTGSRLPGFAEKIGEVLGAEAEPLELLERVDHKLSGDEQEACADDIGPALGLAYKLNGYDTTETDFRREEAAYTRKFDQIKTPLIVLSFLLFLAVAFRGLDSLMGVQRLEREYAQIIATGTKQLAYLMQDEDAAKARVAGAAQGPRKVQALLDAVEDMRDDIENKLGRGTSIPELPSALAVWIELFETIRENELPIGRFALERVDIDVTGNSKTVKMTGEVEDNSRYQALEDALRGNELFVDIKSAGTKQTANGTLKFTDLVITLPDDYPDVEA